MDVIHLMITKANTEKFNKSIVLCTLFIIFIIKSMLKIFHNKL